jgi:hypothetical protein
VAKAAAPDRGRGRDGGRARRSLLVSGGLRAATGVATTMFSRKYEDRLRRVNPRAAAAADDRLRNIAIQKSLK